MWNDKNNWMKNENGETRTPIKSWEHPVLAG